MYDSLYDALTVVVDEGQRAALIGYRQGQLIVIHQTDLQQQH